MPVISAAFPLRLDVHLQPSRARLRALDWRGRVVREEQRPCAPGNGATPWSASMEAARALLAAPGRMRGRRAPAAPAATRRRSPATLS
jgi:hypothetical protein